MPQERAIMIFLHITCNLIKICFIQFFFNFIRVHVNISVLWNIYFVNYVVNNDQNVRPEIKADITLTVCSQNEKKLKP